jgi:hypothetical protein
MKLTTTLLALLLAAVAHAQLDRVLWDRLGAGDSSRYGGRIVALGDQNEDGYADFAMQAAGWGHPGQPSEELIEFFHGGNPPSPEPYMTYANSPGLTDDGMYFTNIGDINGDGFQDWQIQAHYLNNPDSFIANLYFGGPNADLIPDLSLGIPAGDGEIGAVGDFNGDGYSDIYRFYFPPFDYGEIFFGGDPMDLIPDWTRHSPIGSRYQAWPDAYGDFNNNGYSDFISSTPPPENTTYFFIGGQSPDTIPAYVWTNFYSSADRIVNSLNADGIPDLAIGRPGAQVDIHFGNSIVSEIPNYTLQFQTGCTSRDIVSAGDLNHDGYKDLVVLDDGCNSLWGTLSVYLGHPWLNQDPAVTIQGRTLPLNLVGIFTAAGLGDVNGDSIDDLAIGAFNSNFDGWRGRAIILSGDTTLIVSANSPRPEVFQDFHLTVYPNPFNAETTIRLNAPLSATPVSLTVVNLLGQTVVKRILPPFTGAYDYHFAAHDLSSGLYFVRAQSGDLQATQKLMLLR